MTAPAPGSSSDPAPGWYPDPHVPMQMRWWDGTAWSQDTYERTEPLSPSRRVPSAPSGASAPSADTGSAPTTSTPQDVATQDVATQDVATQDVATQDAAPQAPTHPADRTGAVVRRGRRVQASTTDDGVRLAGWWWRVLARGIDGLVLSLISTAVTWQSSGALRRYVDTDLADQLSTLFSSSGSDVVFSLPDDVARSLYVLSIVQLVLSIGYEMGFLLWRSGTPGKLVLGLRVRRWARAGRLDLTVVAKRVLASDIASSLPQVGQLYYLVDSVWPLRDPRRQALHDKLAGTCVVRPSR